MKTFLFEPNSQEKQLFREEARIKNEINLVGVCLAIMSSRKKYTKQICFFPGNEFFTGIEPIQCFKVLRRIYLFLFFPKSVDKSLAKTVRYLNSMNFQSFPANRK